MGLRDFFGFGVLSKVMGIRVSGAGVGLLWGLY